MSNDPRATMQQFAMALSRQSTLSPNEAESFIAMFFDVIRESLVTDKIVKVRGLGTFKLVDVEPRESVKVGTGERFTIEGHAKVSFTPDPVLRDAVNRPFADFETFVINDGVDLEALESVEPTEEVLPQAEEPTYEEQPLVSAAATEPSTDDSSDNPSEAPTDNLIEALPDEPEEEPEDKPADEPEEEPSDEFEDEPIDELEEEPTDSSAEEADESLAEEPLDEMGDEPVDEPTDLSAEEPLDEMGDEPMDEPTDEPAEEPLDESEDEPAEVSTGSGAAAPIFVASSGSGNAEAADEPRQSGQSEEKDGIRKATIVHHADVVEVADYVRHSEKTSHRHRHRRWPGCLFGLLCLVLGYIIGCYFPMKMPTLVTNRQIVNFLQNITYQIDKFTSSLEAKMDTTQVEAPAVESDVTESDDERDSKPAVKSEAPASKPEAPAAKPEAPAPNVGTSWRKPEAKPAAPAQAATQPSAASYPQLPGGKYLIVGVEGHEVMSSGKTLLNISLKYYGSKDFVSYICAMNGITNPDIVPLNKELVIPKLKKKN